MARNSNKKWSTRVPEPQTILQLRFSVSFAITFTTWNLIRAASFRLLPRSIRPFLPPKPVPVPICWSPSFTPVSSHISSTHRISHLRKQSSNNALTANVLSPGPGSGAQLRSRGSAREHHGVVCAAQGDHGLKRTVRDETQKNSRWLMMVVVEACKPNQGGKLQSSQYQSQFSRLSCHTCAAKEIASKQSGRVLQTS